MSPPTPLTPSAIPRAAFLAALRRYPSLVPATLSALDHARYTAIPAALSERRQRTASAEFALTRAELVTLVEWKLRHGTFRPTLLALVQQNGEDAVAATSARAFAELFGSGGEDEEGGKGNVLRALKTLTGLRGVGPATASLVLSCADAARVPFFADEVFRWCFWGVEDKGKGKGWARKIGYTKKEYRGLVERVQVVVERLKGWGVADELEMGEALAVEKVAWVLGKEGVDCGKGMNGGGDGGEEIVEGKGTKREAEDQGQARAKKVKKEKIEGTNGNEQKEAAKRRKKNQGQMDAAEDTPRRRTRSSMRIKT
ncbi:hypothetical protein B0J12DRAFT_316595 [Macrophomina phaseolina]|uniref:DNA glycosylase n=1 Tax=Macrophomina phaseolina TaxID=35725 RepID=A0ABQ8FWZ4_9PEZI|nr:hypothetical protein B0J12DRAFT_316595 [Macrophomina phaseolina]